jgi:two-component system sensor histidine kinase MtrB
VKIGEYFRTSLFRKVFSVSSIISIAVIYFLGSNLYNRIADGIIEEKISSAISEGEAAIQYADYRFLIGGLNRNTNYKTIVDEIVKSTSVSAKASGREIALLSSSGKRVAGIPSRATSNFLQPSSIPSELRQLVAQDDEIHWQRTNLQYFNGESFAGVAVGHRIDIKSVGRYEMYVLFDFASQQQTIDLIGRSMWGSGLILMALIMIIASVVLRQVIKPVRYAAEVAEQLSSGDLLKRMKVKGSDEVARLGTAFNDMADTLAKQITSLENLSKLQQRFVSDVSHELRTPLTTIRMASDLIYAARQGFDPTIARSAELLLSQIDRFEELLTDLLEVSRFDAQVATLSLSRIDLVKLVNRCVEDVAMDAKQRDVEIRIDSPHEEVLIDGDLRRIERIMRNLLGNAIDHAEGNPVDITINGGESSVSISVRDYGVGIAANHLERVFDRFWRADPSRSRIRGGTGLGLSIARGDADLHGGDIKLWSELGAGSQFVLTLPLTQDRAITEVPIGELPTN